MAPNLKMQCFVAVLSVLLVSTPVAHGNFVRSSLNSIYSWLGNAGSMLSEHTICKYTCSNGEDPIPNPKHVKTANGCGSYGLQLDTTRYPSLTRCCNTHDHCYGQCGTIKHECDEALRDCLLASCEDLNHSGILTHKGYVSCSELSTMMYDIVYVVGCKAFVDGQDCLPC